MKKIFIISTVFAATLLASCTQEPVQPTEKKINSEVVYRDPANKAPMLAPRRSCDVNGNTWAEIPAEVTEQEVADVLAYIATRPAGVNWPEGCVNYYIQHVGGAHVKYSYFDMNGAKHDGIDGTSSMENFEIQEQDGNWVLVNNFNGGKCNNQATHNAARMNNGFKAARALNEYASSGIYRWKLFYFNGAYYLGLDFSMKKGDGEIPADGVYDDWVVKIIPIDGNKETPEDNPDLKPVPEPTPDDEDEVDGGRAHVEFDIHQQEHKDWKEIKTSIHLRDTVDAYILITIPQEYQANPDDFAIRGGEMYEYINKTITIQNQDYNIIFTVAHTQEGISIYVGGANCAEALRAARQAYGDGLTFEVHTYVKAVVNDQPVGDDLVWTMLKNSTVTTDPTHLFGQITSAFYPEDGIYLDNEK